MATHREGPLDRPLEELGGALEAALRARGVTWRMHRVERTAGWFSLERKRLLRPAIPCRAMLQSDGQCRTTLVVEAPTEALAQRLARELLAMAQRPQ